MFELWRLPFTRTMSVVPSAFLERVRAHLARMVDMNRGGVVEPASAINILGAGMSVNPLLTSQVDGIITRRGSARFPMRVESLAPTTANVTARNASPTDIAIVDATGQTAVRSVIVNVTANTEEGEIFIISATPDATFDTLIDSSGGGSNPLFSFGAGTYTNTDPEWVALWFDPQRNGTNANGEWAVLAHGAT